MERKLQERLVGAGVLILALVIVGPMILDGRPGDSGEPVVAPGQRPEELRSQTFRLDEAAPRPAGPAVPTGDRVAAANPATAPAPALNPQPAAQTKSADTRERPASPAVDPASVPASAPLAAPVQPRAAVAAPPAKVTSKAAVVTPPQAEVQPASPVGGGFVVQVGTFGQKENADRLVTTLKGRSFAAFVSPVSRDGKTLYRVRVGPAGSRQSASSLAERLAAAGQAGQVVAQ